MGDVLALMKARSKAIEECAGSDVVNEEDRKQLKERYEELNYWYYGVRVGVVSGILGAVNWKKQVPFTRRELPLAGLTLVLLVAGDYYASQLAFGKCEPLLVKYTGFKDGIYVHPNKFSSMRKSFANAQPTYDENQDLMDDNDA